jgi:PAS domain S-box-containing protein
MPDAFLQPAATTKSHSLLAADIIIANAPDPVFVSDLEGRILQANDAVSHLLGFRQDEVLEQSLSRFISTDEAREFTAALREVVERGVTRNVVLNPRSASGEVIPTSLNASALRDPEGKVIGAIGILRDMRELDKARAYAESLIKNAPDPVFVSDLEGKILQANDAVSQVLGFRPDELIEQSLSRFISPEETREFTAALREVVERGVSRNARLNPRSASGEIIPTSLNASALRDPDGKVIGAIGILRDMREQDKARAYAESLIKNAPDPVFVSDLEGKILQANDAVSQLLGFRQDEVLEQSLSRFISPAETREFMAALDEVVERGVTRNARLNPRSASGEIIPMTLNASGLRDPDGKVIGAIGILRDMREIDKARAYAESLIKNAPDPVFVSDLEGKILQANDAVFALLGFRPDELIEQSLSRILSPEETREFLAALREVVEREERTGDNNGKQGLERGVTRNVSLNPRTASGEIIPTSLNASALRDSQGKVIGAIGILRDMRELDKARAYAESLIKNAPDPVFVSDLEGKILQANDAVFALLGFRQDELLEQSLSRFISAEETREFTAALREVVERGVTRNARLNPRSASGEIISTSLNASALRDVEGKVIGAIGILRDMRELDKARAYAESLIKNAPDPVFVSDLEGKILQANDAVFALLGFRQDELLEQSLSRFISAEETREFTAALREVVARGVTRNARLNPRSASGEIIPTTLNASALRDPDGRVIGAIGILRDMRAYEQAVRDLQQSKAELQEKILDLEKFEEVVVGRELKMIALEKELDNLRQTLGKAYSGDERN